MVYQDVVGPILEEVMSGYNCTIFAYGQTGTGKTHTMEGDLTSQMGTYSAEAGIIPRSLYRLFHTLELSKEDYSVKATFIELYNEELRDLLSLDSPPTAEKEHGLRMYDDARGKGVVIQGLEEVPLKDASHGLTVLRRGSNKRSIAATNCNEQSSRSHSVFTMTVFIKDKGSKNEDVLKIGKLNLVDLAGSENIGRSGAQNSRAREAGMINQSLLTLGRVINALVEKSGHIPYRESKLTRLLQESLGGRTKTCIIATVSQDRSNIEETLSTLDYALRAKSIKNRPELNTRMTRSALIKEYVSEIERLKGDLQASRDQNGIYLTEESWKVMHSEHEERKSLTDTLKRQAEVTESKLTSLKEQFEQNMQLLLKREAEVKVAKSECADRVAELETMIAKAQELEETVEEEVALRKAYMQSEKQLDQTASALREVVEESTKDVQGLFDKLERKGKVELANRALVAECRTAVSQRAEQLEASLGTFHSAESHFHSSLRSILENLVSGTEKRNEEQQELLQSRLKKISTSLREVRSSQLESKDLLSTLLNDLDGTINDLQTSTSNSLNSLKETCRGAINDVVLANTQRFAQVAASLDSMVKTHVAALSDVQRVNEANEERILEIKAAAEKEREEEMARLQEQNALLTATVENLKRDNVARKTELLADFGKLLDRFTDQQESELSTSITPIQTLVRLSTEASASHATAQATQLDTLSSATTQITTQLETSQSALVEQSTLISSDVSQASGELGTKMDAFASAIEEDLSSSTTSAMQAHQELVNLSARAREEIESRTKSSSTKIKGINSKLTETFDALSSTLSTSSAEVSNTAQEVVGGIEKRAKEVEGWAGEVQAELKGLKENGVRGLKEDVKTGSTPVKKVWKMPGKWTLVPGNREDAVRVGKMVTDTLTSTTTLEDVPSSEVGMEQSSDEPVAEDEVVEEQAPKTVRPLRELDSNLPTSNSNEDLGPIIKEVGVAKSRTAAKNKLVAPTTTGLPVSKRARS